MNSWGGQVGSRIISLACSDTQHSPVGAMWRGVGLRSLAGAAAAGSLQMKANQPTHAEGSHAPCCKIEKPVSGMPAAQAKWQWQVPDGEKPNHLAFYVPRDPGIFANAAVGSLATKLISHGSVEYLSS